MISSGSREFARGARGGQGRDQTGRTSESWRSAPRGRSRGFGELLSSSRGQSSNAGSRGQSRGGGQSSQGTRSVSHSHKSYTNSQKENQQPNVSVDKDQHGRQHSRKPFERKGPVFGFKRLFGLTSETPDAVILSIEKDIDAWSQLLNSPSEELNDELLALVLAILGEKICSDSVTLLISQQFGILQKSNSPNFIAKVNEKCQRLIDGDSSRNAGLTEIPDSPRAILSNFYKYARFMVRKMPETARDFLKTPLTTAIVTVLTLSTGDTTLNHLAQKFQEIRLEMQTLVKKSEEKKPPKVIKGYRDIRSEFSKTQVEYMHSQEPPDDFRKLTIVPTAEELLSKEEPYLRPIRTSGPYRNAEHYQDVQFRLLREDFVQPLKKGIQNSMEHRDDYLSQKMRLPLGTIRLYPNVEIKEVELVRELFVYKIQLRPETCKKIKWRSSKRLIFGNLLVFTSDFFETAYFGSVAYRDEKELAKGIVSIVWEGNRPAWAGDEQFIMVECEVYFEAFRHNLEILTKLKLEEFPMSKFIVYSQSEVFPPKFLENTEQLLRIILNEKKINEVTLDFSPLVESTWPSNESLGLDENQYAAFKAALTKEFVIIQGPPGTGKTYLGLRIAEVYLKNLGIWREQVKTKPIRHLKWEHPGDASDTLFEETIRTRATGPIVCVCYTNHALDQFLEGILDIFDKMEDKGKSQYPMIRVGGRCTSERLEPFMLHNISQTIRHGSKWEMPENYYHNTNILTKNINRCRFQRATVMNAVRELRNVQGVVNFSLLDVWEELKKEFPTALWECFQSSEWLGINSEWFSRNNFNPEPILRKWFRMRTDAPVITRRPQNCNQKQEEQENNAAPAQDGNDGLEEDYDMNELMEHRPQDDIYKNDWTRSLNQRGKPLDYIEYLSISRCEQIVSNSRRDILTLEEDRNIPNVDHDLIQSEIAAKRLAIKRAENERRFLSRLFHLQKENILLLPNVEGLAEHLYAEQFEANEITGIRYKWTIAQRWAIYFKVVKRANVLSANKAQELEQTLVSDHKKLNDLKKHGDSHLLKHSLIIGMTTTGAAKNNDLLQSIKSKIVIVEEAAEVLECHIVTSITKHCEQLILIGDHRQLKPSTTVFDLAKKYHLDLSLFERMINNNISCYPLKVQHRMRPEISNLVRDSIYTELIDDAEVMKYPAVKGMTKNLFFLSHSELEKSEKDSLSKSNEFEARFLAGLCRYLVLQGYDGSEITVLCAYLGQMFLLRRYIKDIECCKDVRVTCVDNYQGEENNIILLSLVRSNLESKVGFLAVENRVCVALSRAKMGLYIIGNMSMLTANSGIWSKMEDKLNVGGHCGSVLKLECQVHGTISCITKDSDFREKVPEGGCFIPCEAELKCTHKCVKMCHIRDQSHEEYNCKLPCLKSCDNSHPCKDLCFKKCSPCDERIEKMLPCGHIKMMECHKSPNSVTCDVLVIKDIKCGHGPVELPCHFDPTAHNCGVRLTKELPCLHEKEMQCHQDPADILCKELVLKTLPCGHEQIAECKILPEMVGCEQLVFVTIEACGHASEMTCKDSRNPQKAQKGCKTRCTTRLECGHACTKFCHLTEDPDHEYYECNQICFKKCLEGHRCLGKHVCKDTCRPCITKVERKLACGHNVTLDCYLDPDNAKCEEHCQKIMECGHPCENLCGFSCGPCKINVDKKIEKCGHVINIACGTVPTRDMCETLILPFNPSLCLHYPSVPCKISQTASAEEIMSYCNEPCGQIFDESEGGCGHICSGTCSSCKGGQFHLKCKNECGKTLVCGHVCKFPCSQVCPPCNNDCLMKCEHSVCKTKCGTPCQDCAEKCPWQCEHKSCSKRCGELCDREPCDLPCPKTLQKCGHPCVGFCGEPCPPLCRICDFDELTEWQLLYKEDEEDARFVLLPDCNHSIEVEGLTGHMNTQIVEGQIGVKRCPRCKTIIQNCRRFGNIIKSHLVDVAEVKRKVFGDAKTVLKEQIKLIEKLQKEKGTWDIVLPAIHKFLVHHLVIPVKVPIKRGNRILHFQEKKVDHSTLECLKQIAHYGGTAVGILIKAKSSLKLPLYAELFKRYREFFLEITKRQLPLSAFELRDIDRESERLFDLYQVFIRRSSPKFTDGNTRALPIYERLKAFVLSHGPYDPSKRTTLHQLYKELEDVLRTGLGISDMERRQIITAIGLSQGHWFKCPNGHIYAIADCGGPNQIGQCNECGAAIGGHNHQLLAGNALGSEMDNATASAWPTALMQ